MEIDDRELSAAERDLAMRLAQLADDPSPERRAAIMAAVRGAREPRLAPRTTMGGWRPALAILAAAVILSASTVGVLAASADALPSSPTYSLRVFGERVRLTVADPTSRAQLRITFAHARIVQARMALGHGDRSDAQVLLRDSRQYIDQAQNELGDVPSGQQGQIQNQLNQAGNDEHQAESQLNQQGDQGQNGG